MAANSPKTRRSGRMRTSYSLSLAALLTVCLPCALAADKPAFSRGDLAAANTLRERALADDSSFRLIESLTTEVGPRPAGSAGDKAAVAWAVREMRRQGFASVRTLDVM